MAETKYPAAAEVDPRSGFCWKTKTFHSLRPPAPLPPPSHPLSITDYVTSLLRSCPYPLHTTTAFIDASSGHCLSYYDFLRRIHSLAASLRRCIPSDAAPTAFILSPSSLDLSVLYFALFSLGAVVSPANPLSTTKEISHLVSLCKPHIAFCTRAAASKLPSLPLGTVLIDSPEFESMMTQPPPAADPGSPDQIPISVNQSDPAAILYSSGTTGRVKGVLLTHRNLVALINGLFHNRTKRDVQVVSLLTLPLFHIFGLFMLLRTVAVGDTSVVMKRFDLEAMLRAVERYRVMYMPVSPPIVVALTKSELVQKYDLSSLLALGCGGAPLGKEVAQRFTHRFPDIELSQGYGLTETGGGASGMIGPDECKRYGSVGRLIGNMEAKIVDPTTGVALPPGRQGELWVRGPVIMKGYVGDDEATAATLNSDGWLKTGDLCYIDSDGFLFIVDRLKELIKYKAYQVPPAELEHLLISNPEISDAAVIPYPDEEAGQIPMAYIVRKPSCNINESQVMDFVAKQVAPYKKIRQVVFVSSIPKSPSGKILRRELVKLALSPASARL